MNRPAFVPEAGLTVFSQLRALLVIVAGQNKVPADAMGREELLEEARGELNILSGCAANDHLPNGAAIIIQELLRRDVEVEIVMIHIDKPGASAPNPETLHEGAEVRKKTRLRIDGGHDCLERCFRV